jgi:hypothetical protein
MFPIIVITVIVVVVISSSTGGLFTDIWLIRALHIARGDVT